MPIAKTIVPAFSGSGGPRQYDHAEILRLCLAGLRSKAVAARVGCSYGLVCQVRREYRRMLAAKQK